MLGKAVIKFRCNTIENFQNRRKLQWLFIYLFSTNRLPNEALRPNDDSQSSDEEDSPEEVSENSEFETECYESYTRNY